MAVRAHSRCLAPVALLAVLAFGPSVPAAAAPVDDLLALVPDDAAFCLVVRDLRGQLDKLGKSPLLLKLQGTPMGEAIRKAEGLGHLQELDRQLKTHLNVTLEQVADDILGDGFVFAFWPGRDEGTEHALALARARKPEVLATLAQRLNELELKSGDLASLQPLRYKDVTYQKRTDKNGKVSFQLVHAGLAVIAQDEVMLKGVIDKAPGGGRSRIAAGLHQLGADQAFLTFWINPRAFDAEMAAKGQAQGEPERDVVFRQTFLRYWKELRGLAVSCSLGDVPDLTLHIQMDQANLPPAARRLFAEAAQPSDLWRRWPEDAFVTAAGRLDVANLWRVLQDFAPAGEWRQGEAELQKQARALLGLELTTEVLPNFGPNWGFCVFPPAADQKSWLPQALLAVEVKNRPAGRPLDEATVEALRTLAGSLVLSKPDAEAPTLIKTIMQDNRPVVVLTNPKRFPPGVEPCFTLRPPYIVVASSPAALRRFGDGAGSEANRPTPLLRVSARALREWLRQPATREGLLGLARNEPREEAERNLDNVIQALGALDRIDLVQEPTGGGVNIRLRFHPAVGLK